MVNNVTQIISVIKVMETQYGNEICLLDCNLLSKRLVKPHLYRLKHSDTSCPNCFPCSTSVVQLLSLLHKLNINNSVIAFLNYDLGSTERSCTTPVLYKSQIYNSVTMFPRFNSASSHNSINALQQRFMCIGLSVQCIFTGTPQRAYLMHSNIVINLYQMKCSWFLLFCPRGRQRKVGILQFQCESIRNANSAQRSTIQKGKSFPCHHFIDCINFFQR